MDRTVLEEKLRLPVELYYLEGFKTREIAGMLGIPENTVKTRIFRGRKMLMDRLRKEGYLDGRAYL